MIFGLSSGVTCLALLLKAIILLLIGQATSQ
jgi:hypothetical protein